MSATSCQDNRWTGSRSQPTRKASVAVQVDDRFCPKFKQRNLHLLQGHVSRSRDRNWLQMDQFIKPDPSLGTPVSHQGKSVNRWSSDVSLLNSSFTRIAKTLADISPASRPLLQETMLSGKNPSRKVQLSLTKLLPLTGAPTRSMMHDHIRLFSGMIGEGKYFLKILKMCSPKLKRSVSLSANC